MIKHFILLPIYTILVLTVAFSLFLIFWYLPTELFGYMELPQRIAAHIVYIVSVIWTLIAIFYLGSLE